MSEDHGDTGRSGRNRLAEATSPYLQQHRDNPVHWQEWGPEAFAEAQGRNVPVLLSVGYAACHWCHVMAHESFEDDETAAYLNENFVSVKVDREERPDVDAVYMNATTSMTGQGGWPMTCVLDHQGSPFFAGTYFPKEPRHGQPAFRQVLEAVLDAWHNRGDDVRKVTATIRDHLNQQADLGGSGLTEESFIEAQLIFAGGFDTEAGGFRPGEAVAPKFPPSMVLEFLLRRTQLLEGGESERSRAILWQTMDAMARGGLYDQLGGGFARYAVDQHWVVPHFEKMLYDNAQLVGLYARLHEHPPFARAAVGTADFLLRELRTAEGGFASALDADSEGVEGKFYAWTPAQLIEALGEDDGAWAATAFGVTQAGTFEHGTSTLQLRDEPEGPGAARLVDVRERLLAARSARVRPERDDKVVAAWNGLAITGLCDAGRLLGREEYVEAALAAGQLLVDLHVRESADGLRLLRVSRDGVAGPHAGVLEDYGCVAGGFLSLAGVTGDGVWLERAVGLLDAALAHFAAEDGGFFDTADDAEALVARPRDPGDNASPSGLSAMLHALLAAYAMTGEGRYRTAAEAALTTVSGLVEKAPRFAGWSLAAASALHEGPLEVAVVGAPGPERDALERRARSHAGAVVVVAEADNGTIPLLAGRTALDGQPAAYVCRGFVCDRPVTEVSALDAALSKVLTSE